VRKLSLFFAVACTSFGQVDAEKWIRPDAARLSPIEQRHLLDKICPGHAADAGCNACPADTTFGSLIGGSQTWDVMAITLGHFLTPSSQDALVSGRGCEPQVAGTTDSFLLTKEGQSWRRIRNTSGMNAWDCKKLVASDGRERLVCGARYQIHGHAASYIFLLDPGVDVAETQSSQDFRVGGGICSFAVEDTTEESGPNTTVESGAIERVDFTNLALPHQVRITVSARLGKATIPHEIAEKISQGSGPELQIATVLRRYEFLFDGEKIRPARNNPPMDGLTAVAPQTSYSIAK
jgi:hypothetical protein